MPTLQTSRFRPFLSLGIVLLLAFLVVLAVKSFSREVVEVHVAEVNHQNLVSSVSTNGKVEPVEEYQAHASAPGVVAKIFVQPGQKVKAGQMLIQMDDPFANSRLATAASALTTAQISQQGVTQNGTHEERLAAAADLSRAQLQQKQAAADVQTLRTLQQKGAASPAEVTAAEQRLLAANNSLQTLQQRSTGRYGKEDLERAHAQVADAQAGLEAARHSFDNANIRSPMSGTVYSVPVSAYDFVPAGEDLMDIADLNRIQVRAYFDEPEIGKLSQGQAVKIVWDAKPLQAWHGHIERAPTTVITYGTRNVGECIITVDDARGDLLPNTNVTVTVTTAQRFNVLSIPREALHTEGNSDFVYKVVNEKLVRTPVQIGILNLTRVEITSGLTDKDIVALNATSNRDLVNGLAVKVVE